MAPERMSSTDRQYERVVAGVERFIEENYGRSDLKVSDFCKKAKVTERTVNRATKANDKSWRVMLHKKRMQVAKLRIEETEDPIATIGKECGYNSFANFSATFHKEYGITPREHRQIQRGEYL